MNIHSIWVSPATKFLHLSNRACKISISYYFYSVVIPFMVILVLKVLLPKYYILWACMITSKICARDNPDFLFMISHKKPQRPSF
jgi:hypothetical protein